MKYSEEELKEMAIAFLGMLNANVDIRPRAVMIMLSQMFGLSEQQVWQKINDMANGCYKEDMK